MLVASEHPFLPPHLTPELMVADRRQKREIRQLEQELHKWQVLVDSITGEEAWAPEGSLFSILRPSLCRCCCLAGDTLVSQAPTPFPYKPCPGSCLAFWPSGVGSSKLPLLPGMSSPDFDNQTLAVLRGRMVRYLMRSREVRQAHPRPS